MERTSLPLVARSTRTAPLKSDLITSVGGGLRAAAASSCCILPLALFTVGISGAWIANLTALEPY